MSATARAVLPAHESRLFVGGSWRAATGGATFAVEDPATGEAVAEVADATPQDAEAALAAADAAFAGWRATAPRRRADVLRCAYELMGERREQLATLITIEMGKPLAEARAEVAYAASYLRWYAEEAVRVNGRFAADEDGAGRVLTLRQPVGPCLFVTPWNFPLAMGARKLAPALAVGCTCVVKPARQTPLAMLALARILEQAGVPPGVVNVVTTSASAPAIEPLLADPRVRKLSFTGSTAIGRRLLGLAAQQVLNASMELGGNAPFLVFDDADLDAAVDGALLAKMRNGGEACTSANRFLVHEAVAGAFAQRLAERMSALAVGHGLDEGVEVGPLIDDAQRSTVVALVDDAVARGARVLTGGHRIDGPGWFYAPTVLADVPVDAALLREEVFGPVAPIVAFGQEEDALVAANRTEYGLAAYLYTRDLERALRLAEGLEAGMVGLNRGSVSSAAAPFGGVKQSGLGREGGPEGLDAYLETKYVALRAGPAPSPAEADHGR